MDLSLVDFSGTYLMTRQGHGSSCRPQQLPAPLLTDTTQYVWLSGVSTASSANIRVRQHGGGITIAALDSNGQERVVDLLIGTIDIASRTASMAGNAAPLAEGPRQGGNMLYVTEAMSGTAIFTPKPGAPPGGIAGTAATTFTTGTFTFQVGGPGGAVFTTCFVSDTASGIWGSPAPPLTQFHPPG